MYTAIIEIPKDSDRRIHLSFDKSSFVDLGPIKEHVPVNNGIMPVHYGFIDDTINKKEGDEVDVIVFSNKSYKTGDKVEIEILGILKRQDGDDKIIARDDTVSNDVFETLPKNEHELIVNFLGYKSSIIEIGLKDHALEYLKNSISK